MLLKLQKKKKSYLGILMLYDTLDCHSFYFVPLKFAKSIKVFGLNDFCYIMVFLLHLLLIDICTIIKLTEGFKS